MIISFCGCQGTVGKSLNCLNIGSALIRAHNRVLYIDLDANAHITIVLHF